MQIEIEVDGTVTTHDLSPDELFLDIGRSSRNDIVLAQTATVSARHLTLRWSRGWWAQDQSTNGFTHNEVWSKGTQVRLNEGDVLEIEGHVLLLSRLPDPDDAEVTDRAALLMQLRVDGRRVDLVTAEGRLTPPIRPQQARLLRLLTLAWGGYQFQVIERDDEFDLLGPGDPKKDPNTRLYAARARLRQWWRQLRDRHPQQLGGLPRDLLRTEGGQIRLAFRVNSVIVDGRELR